MARQIATITEESQAPACEGMEEAVARQPRHDAERDTEDRQAGKPQHDEPYQRGGGQHRHLA